MLSNVNVKAIMLRNFLQPVLKEKYGEFNDLIERIGYSLQTQKDVETFAKLITEVHNMAAQNTLEKCKEQIKIHTKNFEIK